MTFPNLFFCYIYSYNYGQQIYKKIMKKSTLRQLIREEIQKLNETDRSKFSYIDDDVLDKWDMLIKNMPNELKQAILDIDTGSKDTHSEKKPSMDSRGKNYVYQNVKGKPTTPWNKKVKSLVGGDLFTFHLYMNKK